MGRIKFIIFLILFAISLTVFVGCEGCSNSTPTSPEQTNTQNQ
ncbi:hypothetical protein [Deferribacter autotrophicus]|nr:hypothetical protein [Deferribacter autotrophicus]